MNRYCTTILRNGLGIRHFSQVPKLYGHYASPPARSVIWLLKIHKQPFEMITLDPFKGDTRSPTYTSKFPTALIPALDDNGFYLAEVSAILQYFCEKHKWDQWWPTGQDAASIQKRAKIAEYLSSHHHTSRMVSLNVFRPFVQGVSTGAKWDAAKAKESEPGIFKIASKFEKAFLTQGKYINGMDHPTIADLVAYNEIAQVVQIGVCNFSTMPVLNAWLDNMKQLPEHDNVHQSLFKIAKIGGLLGTK